ncbi:MAG: GIY-YIG nuclease family protein [Candidatus Zixiibacteriota bacterium]
MVLQEFIVYILQSEKNGGYYVGVTGEIESRLNQHNRGASKSTRSNRPWRLVYQERFNTRSEAAKREKQIKDQKSRSYIEGRIRLCHLRSKNGWEESND